MSEKIKQIIQEELGGMFSANANESDADGIQDSDEMLKSLEDEIKDTEDRIGNLKKTVNFPISTDPQIAAKEKVVTREKIGSLEDQIKSKKEQIEQLKGMKSNMDKMQSILNKPEDTETTDSTFDQEVDNSL
jgi:predicted RNase H-like nuclease (RuvC/YqgF family)